MEPKIAPEVEPARYPWLGAVAPGRDVARFGFALALSSALSVVQLFVIPRRVDLETYGHYRAFLVYVAYFGILHLGLSEGAFLQWAGARTATIAREWRVVLRRLMAMQSVVVMVAIVAALLTDDVLPRTYLLALAACAVCVNTAGLSSYALQAAGDFRGAGRVVALAPALFVAAVVVIPVRALAPLLTLYVATFALASLYGARRMTRLGAGVQLDAVRDVPRTRLLIGTGMPVLGANIAANLSQSADRILLTLFAPIASFALYGFASTVTIAANTATMALSRVALSHAARHPEAQRAHFLGGFYNVIAAGYGIALLGEPLFEHLVTAQLPAYSAALPIVRALTLGLPFWVATHVVLVTTLQSHGFVRRQLALELLGVAMVVMACGVALMQHAELWVVAAAASAAAVATFGLGLAFVRHYIASTHLGDALRYVLMISVQGSALIVAASTTNWWIGRTLIVAALSVAPTVVAFKHARERGWVSGRNER